MSVHSFGEPIEQLTLKEKVLAVLRKNLITGDLVEGPLYSAAAIAADLGVSTSPVREALLTLVDQGVMQAVRNRGYRVVPLGEQDRQEIHQMRSLLEIPSMVALTGHSEVRRREAEFTSLATDIVTAAGSGNMVRYLESDLAFHLGLLAIRGNSRLVAAVRSLRDQTRQLRLTALIGTADLAAAARSHLDIVEALVSGTADQVSRLMEEHLEHIRTDWHAGASASAPGSAGS